MTNTPTNPWPGLFKASSLTRRQEHGSSQGCVSTSRKRGRQRGCSVGAIYFLLVQLPWWAPAGQWLARTASLSQTGTCPSGAGQTRGTHPNHTSRFRRLRNSPRRTGPQSALRDSLNDGAHAGTWRGDPKEQTNSLEGEHLSILFQKQKHSSRAGGETPLSVHLPGKAARFCPRVSGFEHIPFRPS